MQRNRIIMEGYMKEKKLIRPHVALFDKVDK